MLIPFDILKVAQACAVLLKSEPSRRMSRLRLLKVLYIADREYLAERGRPITGDRVAAMDHGPVLSRTYDLIKGTDPGTATWCRNLRTLGARDVELGEDPGVGKLSRFEIEKLQRVATRLADLDDWSVAELTPDFPEWEKNVPAKGTSKPIPLDDLLAATGRLDQKESLLADERALQAADHIFGQ
jgi:uncharacterized phage-associated protein